MLLDYLRAAIEKAHYEMIEDEEPYYGEIPGMEGLWATGTTLEGCRRSLMDALEDWVFFSISRGEALPPIGETVLEPLDDPSFRSMVEESKSATRATKGDLS